jgi:hypothetical protein
MTRLAILAAILALSGCGSDCPTVDTQAIAAKAYQQAESDINIGNLERLRGEMVVCQVIGITPMAFQNAIGLDCSRNYAAFPDINKVSADLPLRAIAMAIAILAIAGLLLSILIPPLGRISGQWRAALEMRVAALRERHEREIQADIESARKRLRELEIRAEVADAKAEAAEARQRDAEASAEEIEDELEEQTTQLRDELTKRLRLAKVAETTADLANLLSSLDRHPD